MWPENLVSCQTWRVRKDRNFNKTMSMCTAIEVPIYIIFWSQHSLFLCLLQSTEGLRELSFCSSALNFLRLLSIVGLMFVYLAVLQERCCSSVKETCEKTVMSIFVLSVCSAPSWVSARVAQCIVAAAGNIPKTDISGGVWQHYGHACIQLCGLHFFVWLQKYAFCNA